MPELRALPLEEWESTKDTLHLWAQIVGKIRLATAPPQNHWWNATLYVDACGLTTRRIRASGRDVELAFDFVGHRFLVRTGEGVESFPLEDGLSVADFYEQVFALLRRAGIEVEIRAVPYGVPFETPFAEDREHASYDREYVERFRDAFRWVEQTFEEFAGWFCGKSSPVQVFWHSFDIAVTRFSGRRAPDMPGANAVTREAYSHEVISFGFWAGDATVRTPTFYSYTAPEPGGLTDAPLRPGAAFWVPTGASHQARLDYEDVRRASDPRAELLAFLESAYEAGATAAGWDEPSLRSSWHPRAPG
jgi:hypothetical protein